MKIHFLDRPIYVILACTIFTSLSLNAKSISSLIDNYQEFCRQAANNDDIFHQFKNSPIYRDVLEHVTYQQGFEYLFYIQENYSELLNGLSIAQENDLLGNPIVFEYPSFGSFSPTTLRYLKVVGDLKSQFKDLSKMHIVEIGGGYGGQCKLLHDLAGFASYTIVDLPECNLLIRKYINQFGIKNVYCIDNNKLDRIGKYDLVISNYGINEVEREEQLEYLEKIMNPTLHGYITGSFKIKNFVLPFLLIEELVEMLMKNKRTIILNNEVPLTGDDNQILIWKPSN